MGKTPFFGLDYFDFNDRLDSQTSVQKEISRFLTIDLQLYGLYSIFGSGVITGFEVSQVNSNLSTGISISIGSGQCIINYLFCELNFPIQIGSLKPNSVLDVYVKLEGNLAQDRTVSVYATDINSTDLYSLRISRVITSSNGIISIDNSFRDEISFLNLIRREIALHKHTGSPSKIDLRSETKNQLPGARIQNLDASKISTGKFDINRIPVIDHNLLKNNGVIPHAGLDSFVKTLTDSNKVVLGEIFDVNQIRLYLYLKDLYPDVDKNTQNALYFIPGISPNKFIDFDSTTANVNLDSHCISGVPFSRGQLSSIIWNTNFSFMSYYDSSNINISNNSVYISRGDNSLKFIENFESVIKSGQPIPGFSKDFEIIVDESDVVSESADSLKTQGFYSGKFSTSRDYRIIYRKKLNGIDASIYDEILLDIKSIESVHGSVFMYLVNGSGDDSVKSPEFLILGQDEITSSQDPLLNGFERRSFSLSSFKRDNLTEIVLYTDDYVSKQIFYVDNIFLRNQSLYNDIGKIRYRYSSSNNITFYTINYNINSPDGTYYTVRYRTANNTSLLAQSVYSSNIRSGELIDQQGTDIEIEISLFSDKSKKFTPTLDFLELQISSVSKENGFSIDSVQSWNFGNYDNSSLDSNLLGENVLRIKDPISVDNYYFNYKNNLNEIDPERIAILGYSGNDLPISISQAINYQKNQKQNGLDNPYSLFRKTDKGYIICDTFNDRIVEIDYNGKFIKGIASHNFNSESSLYPLTSCYNPENGILTITFSKSIDRSKVDLSKINIFIASSKISLGSSDIIVNKDKIPRILEILLSSDKQQELFYSKSDVFVQINSGTISESIDQNTNYRSLYSIRGLPCFIGNYSYIDGLSHPIHVSKNINDNIYICNSSVRKEVKSEVSTDQSNLKTIIAGNKLSFDITLDPIPATGSFVSWDVKTSPTPKGISPSWSTSSDGNSITLLWVPEEQDVGNFVLIFDSTITSPNGLISKQSRAINVQVNSSGSSPSGQSEPLFNSPSFCEIDSNNDIIYSYDDIKFSDYSLGSFYEINSDNILISGISGTESSTTTDSGNTPTDQNETYEQEASRILQNYRGKTIVLEKSTNNILFSYDSPDGLYASDCYLDINNNYVVAETSFSGNSGRVIKIDTFGNIIYQLSGRLFSKINDVRITKNNNIIIST